MWVAMVVSCNDVVPYSSPCCKALVAQCSKFFPSVRSSAEACVCPSPLCKIWGPKEHVIPPMKALLYSNSDPNHSSSCACMHSFLPPCVGDSHSTTGFTTMNLLQKLVVCMKVNQTLEWKLHSSFNIASCQHSKVYTPQAHILSTNPKLPNPEYELPNPTSK